MGITLKIGVTITVTPQIDRILRYAALCYQSVMGPDFIVTVTAGSDGHHGEQSLHYKNLAVDLRTGHSWSPPLMTPQEAKDIRDELALRLGAGYDVVLEGDHIHAEYDPKVPKAA